MTCYFQFVHPLMVYIPVVTGAKQGCDTHQVVFAILSVHSQTFFMIILEVEMAYHKKSYENFFTVSCKLVENQFTDRHLKGTDI